MWNIALASSLSKTSTLRRFYASLGGTPDQKICLRIPPGKPTLSLRSVIRVQPREHGWKLVKPHLVNSCNK